MAACLLIFLLFCLPMVLYCDATSHRIGRVPGSQTDLILPAGAWAALTLLPGLGFLIVICYTVSLARLIAQAKAFPSMQSQNATDRVLLPPVPF